MRPVAIHVFTTNVRFDAYTHRNLNTELTIRDERTKAKGHTWEGKKDCEWGWGAQRQPGVGIVTSGSG